MKALCFIALLAISMSLFGDHKVAYTGLTPDQNREFEDKIDRALMKEELRVKQLKEKIEQKAKKLPPSVQLELTKAKLTLQIKTTLAKNYLRTSILASEAVREELVRLMDKSSVNLDDLIALQKLVNEEKKQIN